MEGHSRAALCRMDITEVSHRNSPLHSAPPEATTPGANPQPSESTEGGARGEAMMRTRGLLDLCVKKALQGPGFFTSAPCSILPCCASHFPVPRTQYPETTI